MPKVKAAAVQFAPVFKDVEGNLTKLSRLVIRAARGGAKLVVLPELATTGYSLMSKSEAESFAEPISEGPTFRLMRALSKRLGVHIVWGMVERDLGTGHIFNSQVYVDPAGYRESYRKINLWGNDILWSEEGRGNPPVIRASFFTDDGEEITRKVGLLVCRDVRDKKDSKWSDFYEKGDADVVAFSANWGKGGFPSTTWWDFAKRNKCHLVVSNRYGIESHNDFGDGGVCIIDPDGTVHCDGLEWGHDCIVYSDI